MKRMTVIRLTLEVTALMLIGLSDKASGISCYQCIDTHTTSEVTSTCKDSLSSGSGTSGQCSGSICRTRWSLYSSQSTCNNHRDHECIGTEEQLPTLDHCDGEINNKTYFVYQGQCCYTTGTKVDYGTVYVVTECYCQRDYCNAVVSSPITSFDDTADTLPTTSQRITGTFPSGLGLTTVTSLLTRNGDLPTTVLYYTTAVESNRTSGTNILMASLQLTVFQAVVSRFLLDV